MIHDLGKVYFAGLWIGLVDQVIVDLGKELPAGVQVDFQDLYFR
jgi:hypothetical protein